MEFRTVFHSMSKPVVTAPVVGAERSAHRRGRIIVCWTLLVATLMTFLSLVAWRGRLAHIDEVFYKAAGYHWSTRGTFAAPELTGRLRWDPPIEQVFACYPPVYPFVFGLYTSVVGIGWRQVAMFDAMVHVLLCLATALMVLRLLRSVPD